MGSRALLLAVSRVAPLIFLFGSMALSNAVQTIPVEPVAHEPVPIHENEPETPANQVHEEQEGFSFSRFFFDESPESEGPFTSAPECVSTRTLTLPGPTYYHHFGPGQIAPRLLVVLPDSDAFQNVFGHAPSHAEQKEFNQYRAVCRDENAEVLQDTHSGEAQFEASFTSTVERGANIVAIIGHSEIHGDQQLLILPDGSRVSYDEILKLATRLNVHAVLVTCQSRDLGLKTAISYSDAFAMWHEAEASIKSGRSGDEPPSDELSSFVFSASDVRQRRYAPGTRVFVFTQQDLESHIYEFRFRKPKRTLFFAAIWAIILIGANFLMYRIGRYSLHSKVESAAEFKSALVAGLRKQRERLENWILLATFSVVIAALFYVFAAEYWMSYQDESGGRTGVYISCTISTVICCLLFCAQLRRPLAGFFRVVHGVCGAIAGAGFGALIAAPLGLVCFAIFSIFEPITNLIPALRDWPGPVFAILICLLGAVRGSVFGSKMGWRGLPVHQPGKMFGLVGESSKRVSPAP
jgi:hypothetical protein